MSTQSQHDTPSDIDALLDELEQQMNADAAVDPFYDRLLTSIARATDGVWCEFWRSDEGGLRRQHREAAGDANGGADERGLTPVLRTIEPTVVSDASGRLALASPVRNASGPVGVVVCGRFHGCDEAVARTLLPVLGAFVEVADQFELRRQVRSLDETTKQANKRRTAGDAFVLDLHDAADTQTIARHTAEEGRRLIDADRLTVLLPAGAGWRVAAVSGVAKPSRRSDAVQGCERLATAAMRIGDPLVVRDGRPLDLPPQLERELLAHMERGGVRELAVLPCRRDGAKRAEAVLLVEHFSGTLPDDLETSALVVQEHTAVALRRARGAGLLGAVRRRLADARALRGVVLTALAAALVASAIAALVLVPAELTISAEGRLTPLHRRRVFAPTDATVERLLVDHGDVVQAGQPLVRMRSEPLEVDLEEAHERLATTRQEITSLETAKLRAGLPTAAPGADVSALAARIAALREQVGYQQRRVELLETQQAGLTITSPIAGRVLSWRPQDYLAERPVRRGQRLLEVAELDGAWGVELRVVDRLAGHVLRASGASDKPLAVDYVLKSDPAPVRRGRLVRIASATQVDAAGAPVLRVDVAPEGAPDEAPDGPTPIDSAAVPRSGATVLAKIRCGERSLGYVWFHQAWEALQRVWF